MASRAFRDRADRSLDGRSRGSQRRASGRRTERATHVASARLAKLPETRTIASALNLRSAGVKDLRYGYLLEDDWFGLDPDAFPCNPGREIPFLQSAHHYFVSASLSRDGEGRAARLIGDLLVLPPSAWAHAGRGQRLRFPVDHYRHYGGIHHFQLLNHPAIYEQIRTWISGRPALGPAPLMLTAARPEGSATVTLASEHQLLG